MKEVRVRNKVWSEGGWSVEEMSLCTLGMWQIVADCGRGSLLKFCTGLHPASSWEKAR